MRGTVAEISLLTTVLPAPSYQGAGFRGFCTCILGLLCVCVCETLLGVLYLGQMVVEVKVFRWMRKGLFY